SHSTSALTTPPPQPSTTIPYTTLFRSDDTYGRFCELCHGNDGISRGTFPDLLRTPLLHAQEGFDQVVLGGALSERGMASFDEVRSEEHTSELQSRENLVCRPLLDKNDG